MLYIGADRENRTLLCTAWKAGDTPCVYPLGARDWIRTSVEFPLVICSHSHSTALPLVLVNLETPSRIERLSSVLQTEAQPLYQGVIFKTIKQKSTGFLTVLFLDS